MDFVLISNWLNSSPPYVNRDTNNHIFNILFLISSMGFLETILGDSEKGVNTFYIHLCRFWCEM